MSMMLIMMMMLVNYDVNHDDDDYDDYDDDDDDDDDDNDDVRGTTGYHRVTRSTTGYDRVRRGTTGYDGKRRGTTGTTKYDSYVWKKTGREANVSNARRIISKIDEWVRRSTTATFGKNSVDKQIVRRGTTKYDGYVWKKLGREANFSNARRPNFNDTRRTTKYDGYVWEKLA